MKTIDELWKKLEKVELVQVRPIEMQALYERCFEFEYPRIVEIGSAHGASSIILAEAAKELDGELICIDHFPEDYYSQDKFGDYARRAFRRNVVTPYKPTVTHLDLPSDHPATVDFFKNITNIKEIDVLFVDGNHDLEPVRRDITNFLPLVRVGGYIGFHDYYNPAFGVRQAVDETLTNCEGPTQYWDLAVFKKL